MIGGGGVRGENVVVRLRRELASGKLGNNDIDKTYMP
jgi:hypothetical protein